MKAWLGIVLGIGGVLAGVGACCWTRSWDPTTRVTGWPFPIAVLLLEDGHWVDFIGRGWQVLADFLAGFGLALLPYLAWRVFARRAGRPPGTPS